jgi:DNA-binding transcriptional MerR regulator
MTSTPTIDAARPATKGPPAQTWSIAELAREYNVTPRAIRFYEDEGLLSPTRVGMARIYSQGDRWRLGSILRGKRLGFSLAEIKELMDLYHADRSGVQQLRAIVRKSREHVADLEAKLRDLRTQIAEFREVEGHAAQMLRDKGADVESE